MLTLKILRLTNPETQQEVIRPRVVDDGEYYDGEYYDAEYFPVLKPQGDDSYLATIKNILKGDITMSDLRKKVHEEYGTYYVISSIKEIESIDDLDESLV